jgi:secondary thiamine-phosphate synthase enzyme
MKKTIEFNTPPRDTLVDITTRVRAVVQNSAVQEGICVIFIPHTTAALTLNTITDLTVQDLQNEVNRLVPTRVDFQHTYNSPADAAGHIKSSLIGTSLSLIISRGDLILGQAQSILFYEFDGPRQRQVIIRIQRDQDE